MRARLTLPTALYFGLWTAYFTWFWWHALRYDEAGNLVAGNANLWADWALHFTLGNVMAERELLPTSSPLLLGAPFAYPFAADLISALLMKAGVGLVPAFVLPSYACSLLLLVALYYFLGVLFRSGHVAALGASLFLLAGGLGFLQFVRDVAAAADPLATLLDPPQAYTHLADWGIVLLSVIDGMLIPQRSFTLGFPLALIALGLVHSSLAASPEGAQPVSWIRLCAAGLILGLMPLMHAHSMLAAFVILACWAASSLFFTHHGTAWQRLWPWLAVALITTLVALPLIVRFFGHAFSCGFLRWLPGWYARELGIGPFTFWLRNWGPMPLLALAGLALWLSSQRGFADRARELLRFAPFFVLFVLANLFVFAPWLWDNTKLLVWAALGGCGLVAWFCVRLWQEARRWRRGQTGAMYASWLLRLAVLAVLLVSMASGTIDAWRVLRSVHDGHVLYTREDFALAQ